ncbi:hypothetical protein TNCV_2654661 [Trichonephila clavipes]|nr:hypothetical protein TNCV_2654661 [Trichonephila clavipes]
MTPELAPLLRSSTLRQREQIYMSPSTQVGIRTPTPQLDIVVHKFVSLSGRVVSDCGAVGPRFEFRRGMVNVESLRGRGLL